MTVVKRDITKNLIQAYLYTVYLNKKETWTNMPISLKLDKHLNNLGYYLLSTCL